MALGARRNGFIGAATAVLLVVLVSGIVGDSSAEENVVFEVKHKYGGRNHGNGEGSLLSTLKAHDTKRHGRLLSAVDLPLGGDGSPVGSGLYYTKLSIGTPPKDYYVQVDTGSDVTWVNCAGCDHCSKKSDLGIHIQFYDLKSSSSGKAVTCGKKDFCPVNDDGNFTVVCQAGMVCGFSETYLDGSSIAGYFMSDNIMLNQVSGNFQTTPMNGSIVFGCSLQQSNEDGTPTQEVAGLLGLGQANTSIITQLASTGKVRKVFSHCLDRVNGGGIFALGEVMQPKLNMTRLVASGTSYNVILKRIDIGGNNLSLPSNSSFGGESGIKTLIDSGTTLAYLPDVIYDPFIQKIMAGQPNLQTHVVESQFKCFYYKQNLDDGFPVVTFHFKDSLSFTVYPHDYLFEVHDGEWCIGWLSMGDQTKDSQEMVLLGDLVLSNKLVQYDLENQTIGWTAYNCSSSIKVQDENSRNTYSVGAQVLSSASSLQRMIQLAPLLLIAVIYSLVC